MFKAFLIKYAEIAIKGKNRYTFEDALVDQIRHVLKEVDGEFRVVKERGRIYVYAESEFVGCVFAVNVLHVRKHQSRGVAYVHFNYIERFIDAVVVGLVRLDSRAL